MTSKDQAGPLQKLKGDFERLDPWEKGGVMLTLAFQPFTEKQMELVKTGIALMVGWHQKQHPNFQRCNKCETVEQLVLMCKMVEMAYINSRT